jgi:hypothetical protein
MNMVIPDEGKVEMLDELFRLTSTRPTFVLDLVKTNVTVVDASTWADFVVANFTGYVQKAIARADWGAAAAVANVGEIVKTVAPVWTCTGGAAQTIYAWILRNAASGKIWAGQNFATPWVMAPGATFTPDPFKIKDKTFA